MPEGGFLSGLFGIGKQVIGKGLDYAISSALYGKQNEDVREREKEARRENYNYNEMAAQHAYKRQRDFFENYLSTPAQMEQLKAAGLSPSIFAGGGMSGASAPTAPQGSGTSGIGHNHIPFSGQHFFGDTALQQSQIENLNAMTKKIEKEGEKIDIENSNDPIVREYMVIRDEQKKQANERESEQVNSAFNTLQQQLTQISGYSKGDTWSISKSNSDSEGGSSGYTVSHTDAQGHTQSFAVGGSMSVSVGLNNGGSASTNYSRSHGENQSHGESKGENQSYQWAKSVAEATSKGKTESGYTREAINVLEVFYNQVAEATKNADNTRKNAQETFMKKVKHYTDNKAKYEDKQHSKWFKW